MTSDHSTSGSLVKNWKEKLIQLLSGEPEDKNDIVEILQAARQRELLDTDALSMMEGVLGVSELQVRDIMIPRAQMAVINKDDQLADILPVIIESAHSRFPVIGEDRGEVVGILLAKDLLQFCMQSKRFDLKDVLRSAIFVPESKRLNVLLKEFRASRNHMAIVIDEYGAANGLVTIEDVLEQIVGEIEDEHDFDEGTTLLKRSDNEFTAKAHTTIEDFNEYFQSDLPDDDFDTIGGLVINAMGHVPRKDDSVDIGRFRFRVMRADSRKVYLLSISLLPDPEQDSDQTP